MINLTVILMVLLFFVFFYRMLQGTNSLNKPNRLDKNVYAALYNTKKNNNMKFIGDKWLTDPNEKLVDIALIMRAIKI